MSTGMTIAISETERRPLWKTLLVALVICYSPVVALILGSVLIFGSSSPNDVVRVLTGAAGVAAFVIAVFLYFFAWGIAVIYVDRRTHPDSYSFWRACGSTDIVYFSALLPILIVILLVVLAGNR